MANTVRIVVEADDKASGKLKGIQGALGDIGKIAGGVVVANGIMKLPGMFSSATDAAIDLGESTNAVDQIFGDSAGVIKEWGENNANSFGLTRAAFQQMATPLGAMMKNAGLSMEDVTKNTTDLTARAADMASVFNTDVDSALAAISAGLRGEADPLEQYGVSLNAAAVNAKAMAMSGKDSAAALTEQEKATARVALILEQTNDVAGDFNATSDQAANKARIQAAQQEELAASIGQHLLPVQLKLTEAKLAFVKLLAEHLVPALAKTAEWIGEHVVPKLQEFGQFLRTEVGPVIQGTIIPALEEFAAKTAEKFQEFKGYWEKDLRPALENLGEAFELWIGFVIDNWKRLMPVIRPILDELRNRVETAFEIIAGVIDIIVQLLGGDFKGAWQAAQDLVKVVADSFVESMSNAGEMISGLVGVFKKAGTDIIQGLWDAAADKLRDHVIPWFKELPGKLVGAIPNALGILKDIGVSIIQGLWNGMTEKWGEVSGWVGGLGGKIKGLKGPIESDRVLLVEEGKAIMEGLQTGMQDAWGQRVAPAIQVFGADTKAMFEEWQGTLKQNLSDGISMTGEEIWSMLMNIKDSILNSGLNDAGKGAATKMVDGFLKGLSDGAGVANKALSDFLGELIGKANSGMQTVTDVITGGAGDSENGGLSGWNGPDYFTQGGNTLADIAAAGFRNPDHFNAVAHSNVLRSRAISRGLYGDVGGSAPVVNVTIQGPGMAQLASDLRVYQSEVFA